MVDKEKEKVDRVEKGVLEEALEGALRLVAFSFVMGFLLAILIVVVRMCWGMLG